LSFCFWEYHGMEDTVDSLEPVAATIPPLIGVCFYPWELLGQSATWHHRRHSDISQETRVEEYADTRLSITRTMLTGVSGTAAKSGNLGYWDTYEAARARPV
jgi:hypothetical protein